MVNKYDGDCVPHFSLLTIKIARGMFSLKLLVNENWRVKYIEWVIGLCRWCKMECSPYFENSTTKICTDNLQLDP